MTSRLSIVIPTYERPQVLQETLAAMCKLEPVAGFSYELIIVNNSPSCTISLPARMKNGDSGARIVEEPRTGLSHARNCGIAQSRSDWIAFIDDDITVHPQWLHAVYKGIIRYPNAHFFGGRILSTISGTMPEWCGDNRNPQPWTYGKIGHYDLGNTDLAFQADTMNEFFGANFICKKSVLDTQQAFNTKLGLNGQASCYAGEDTELVKRLHETGNRGYYLADAMVRHRVRGSTLNFASLRDYFIRCGRSAAYMDAHRTTTHADDPQTAEKIYRKLGYLLSLLIALEETPAATLTSAVAERKLRIAKTQAYIKELASLTMPKLPNPTRQSYASLYTMLTDQDLSASSCKALKQKFQAWHLATLSKPLVASQ